jgi:hypothetical protein
MIEARQLPYHRGTGAQRGLKRLRGLRGRASEGPTGSFRCAPSVPSAPSAPYLAATPSVIMAGPDGTAPLRRVG